MRPFALGRAVDSVRDGSPLIHCITNYVTVNDCANALLACGASPIMGDDPADAEDITSMCDALLINIGTLNDRTIEAMLVAGKRSAALGHPIVVDPVGAGASRKRTSTASKLLETLPVSVVRGNMSEIKALVGSCSSTRGVDVNPCDVVVEESIPEAVAFACGFASRVGGIVAITGAIDIVADSERAFVIRNGHPLMGSITGSGCMLSCLVAAYAVAGGEDVLTSVAAAVAAEGIAGQMAYGRMRALDGSATFRNYLIDALYNMTGDLLERNARVQLVD